MAALPFQADRKWQVLGLFFHFLIALLFAAIFFILVARILPAASNTSFSTGILYGLFIWLVMNLLVVPLSSVPKMPFNMGDAILSAAILVVCVGIPISYCYYNSTRPSH